MKTTVDLPDALFVAAKKGAAELRERLRAWIERGLRAERPRAGSHAKQPRRTIARATGGQLSLAVPKGSVFYTFQAWKRVVWSLPSTPIRALPMPESMASILCLPSCCGSMTC